MPIVIGNVPLHMPSRGSVCPSGTHVTDTCTTTNQVTDTDQAAEPLETKEPLPP